MVHRTAHRARHAVRQIPRENARLCIQKGAAALRISGVRLLGPVLCLLVGILRRFELRTRRFAVVQQFLYGIQRGFARLCLFLLGEQLCLIRIQSCGLPERFAVGLQGGCLLRDGIRERVFLRFPLPCLLLGRAELTGIVCLHLHIVPQSGQRFTACGLLLLRRQRPFSVHLGLCQRLRLLLPCGQLCALPLLRVLLLLQFGFPCCYLAGELGQRAADIVQLPIARLLGFQRGQRTAQLFLTGQPGLFGLPCGLCRRELLALLCLCPAVFLQPGAGFVLLTGSADQLGNGAVFLVQLRHLLFAALIRLFILLDQRIYERNDVLERHFALFRLFGLREMHQIVLGAHDAVNVLLHAAADGLAL